MRRRVDILRHRGSAVECPLCGGRFDRFKAAWNRPPTRCAGTAARTSATARNGCCFDPPPRAAARRPLAVALRAGVDDARAARAARRRAAGPALRDRRPRAGRRRPPARPHTRSPSPTTPSRRSCARTCLEHVPDDAAAMRELRRVTVEGGWCLVMVPLDLARAETYEDPSGRHARGAAARVPPGRSRPALRPGHRRPARRRGVHRRDDPPRRGPRPRRRPARRPARVRLDLPLPLSRAVRRSGPGAARRR